MRAPKELLSDDTCTMGPSLYKVATKSGPLSLYTEVIYEPLWGKTLSQIVAKIQTLVEQTVIRYALVDHEQP